MSKYLESISISDDAKKLAEFAAAERRAKLQVQIDKVALAEAKSTAEVELAKAESAVPFNLNDVVKAERKLKNIDEDIASADSIAARLF
jgi:hypothetical protein